MAAINGHLEKNRTEDIRAAEEDLKQTSDAVPLRCESSAVAPHRTSA